MIKIRQDKKPDVSEDIEVWLEEENGYVFVCGRNIGNPSTWSILKISEEGIFRFEDCYLNGIARNERAKVKDISDE